MHQHNLTSNNSNKTNKMNIANACMLVLFVTIWYFILFDINLLFLLLYLDIIRYVRSDVVWINYNLPLYTNKLVWRNNNVTDIEQRVLKSDGDRIMRSHSVVYRNLAMFDEVQWHFLNNADVAVYRASSTNRTWTWVNYCWNSRTMLRVTILRLNTRIL